MSLSSDLDSRIQRSMSGGANVIPVKYDRVGDYLDIGKHMYVAIGAETGSGKTTLAHDMYCIDPIEWWLNNQSGGIKLSVIGFFMERAQEEYSARWISRKLWETEGIRLPSNIILPRQRNQCMTVGEYELVKKYYKTLDLWEKEDMLIIHQGSKNPTGISKYLEMFAAKHGIIHKKSKDAMKPENVTIDNVLESVHYEPKHPNHIMLVISDNTGVLAPEGDGKTKTLVDKHSRTMREVRDWYGMSPIVIQQLSRSLSDIHRQRIGDLVPKLSDFADSSQTQRDADIVLALFNPYDHQITEKQHNGYNLDRFKKGFSTYYRSLHVLKNSFGSKGMSFPMALHEEIGMFKTLPKSNEIPDSIYEEVTSGRYFLPSAIEREETQIMKPFKGFGNRDSIMEQVKQTTEI
jgi:DnaB-like helicase C terminal domain